MGKYIGKNTSKKLSGKYSQTILDHAKQSAKDSLKNSSKRVIQKAAEPTGDLTGNKIACRVTKVSKISPQNNSKTVTIEHDKKKDVAKNFLIMLNNLWKMH